MDDRAPMVVDCLLQAQEGGLGLRCQLPDGMEVRVTFPPPITPGSLMQAVMAPIRGLRATFNIVDDHEHLIAAVVESVMSLDPPTLLHTESDLLEGTA